MRASELEREIARLRSNASAQLKLMGRIGHDLNNVLQAIVGEIELFAQNEPDLSKELLQKTMASFESGIHLTNELLSAASGADRIARDPSAAIAVANVAQGGARARAGRGSVLVVDDQGPLREFIGSILVSAEYEVTFASNGGEAVTAVRDGNFCLVLMDIHMPGVNGLMATRRIRKLKGTRSQIPIVAISGNVPLQHVPSLVAAGMNDHLSKPFKTSDLLKMVETWSRQSTAAPATAVPKETTTVAAFERVCSLMGRARALGGLAMLKTQIDELFDSPSAARRETVRLAAQAHALVALAALLGFSSLSESCGALEDGCRSGHGVRLPFRRAKAAAMLARLDAIRLLADEEERTA